MMNISEQALECGGSQLNHCGDATNGLVNPNQITIRPLPNFSFSAQGKPVKFGSKFRLNVDMKITPELVDIANSFGFKLKRAKENATTHPKLRLIRLLREHKLYHDIKKANFGANIIFVNGVPKRHQMNNHQVHIISPKNEPLNDFISKEGNESVTVCECELEQHMVNPCPKCDFEKDNIYVFVDGMQHYNEDLILKLVGLRSTKSVYIMRHNFDGSNGSYFNELMWWRTGHDYEKVTMKINCEDSLAVVPAQDWMLFNNNKCGVSWKAIDTDTTTRVYTIFKFIKGGEYVPRPQVSFEDYMRKPIGYSGYVNIIPINNPTLGYCKMEIIGDSIRMSWDNLLEASCTTIDHYMAAYHKARVLMGLKANHTKCIMVPAEIVFKVASDIAAHKRDEKTLALAVSKVTTYVSKSSKYCLVDSVGKHFLSTREVHAIAIAAFVFGLDDVTNMFAAFTDVNTKTFANYNLFLSSMTYKRFNLIKHVLKVVGVGAALVGLYKFAQFAHPRWRGRTWRGTSLEYWLSKEEATYTTLKNGHRMRTDWSDNSEWIWSPNLSWKSRLKRILSPGFCGYLGFAASAMVAYNVVQHYLDKFYKKVVEWANCVWETVEVPAVCTDVSDYKENLKEGFEIAVPTTNVCLPSQIKTKMYVYSECAYKHATLMNPCVHNAYYGLCERQGQNFQVRLDQQIVSDFSNFVDDFAFKIHCSFIERPSPYVYAYWNNVYEPKKREQHDKAYNRVITQTLDPCNFAVTEGFVKIEPILGKYENDGTPKQFPARIISGTKDEYNVFLGPYTTVVRDCMKILFGNTPLEPDQLNVQSFRSITPMPGLYFASGMNKNKLGDWFTEIVGKCIKPRFYEGDFSKFDGHLNRMLLKSEHKMLLAFFDGNWREELKRLLECQLITEGYVGPFGNKLKVKYEATRRSGDQNTTIGNSLINMAINLFILDDMTTKVYGKRVWELLGESIFLIVMGDDSVIITDDIEVEVLQSITLASGIGMDLKFAEKAQHNVVFCSNLFIPATVNGKDTHIATQLPGKNLVKSYLTEKKYNKQQAETWVYQQSLAYMQDYNHLPFMRKFHRRHRKMPETLVRINRDPREIFKHVERIGECNQQTRNWFTLRYRLPPHFIDELDYFDCHRFKTMNAVIDRIIDVDVYGTFDDDQDLEPEF